MTDHDDTGTRLAAALQDEAERVRPEPALQSILARTRSAPRQSRRWWPAVAGAVSAGALIAVALVVFAAPPTTEPVAVAAQREVTVYMLGADPGAEYDEGRLFPQPVAVTTTGDAGLDAVNGLLTTKTTDPDYINTWWYLQGGNDDNTMAPDAPVSATSVTQQDGVITVDFTGPVDNPWDNTIFEWVVDPRFFSQQLVWTVQDALNSTAPVVVTKDGDPVDMVLTAKVDNPIERDPNALAPVQIGSPEQGETVTSPVTVSGRSATFEANVVWRVKRDGEVVDKGFTTSEGANGVFGPFEFTVKLPPGDYTVEAYEQSAENGEVINLDSKDFTVEATEAEPTKPTPSAETPVTVYSVTRDGALAAETVTVPNTGDPGVDAVNTLLSHQPGDPDYTNVWAAVADQWPINISSVSEADGAVYVDFSGPVDRPRHWEWAEIEGSPDPAMYVQQLVWTVQTALHTDAPLVITKEGARVDAVLNVPVSGISQPDQYALAPVQIESPAQGETVTSPVTVSGQSATFEANVVWRVRQDGEVVDKGFTTSEGANGVFGPFEFTVELPPGDYTVEAYEHSAETGEVINLDSKDFTVE